MAAPMMPLARVKLFARGGEGYLVDPGFTVYDRVALNWPEAEVAHERPSWFTSEFKIPTVVRLPEFNLVTLNPISRWRDQALSEWNVISGEWLEFGPLPFSATDGHMATLLMFVGAGGATGEIRTDFDLPEDPDFHFYFARMRPSRDCEEQAYLRVRFGESLEWMLSWEDGVGTYFGKWEGDHYRPLMELQPRSWPGGPELLYPGIEYCPLKVLTRASRIGVETDPPEGVSALTEPHYQVYYPYNGVTIGQGPMTVEASGVNAFVGLCPVEPPDEGEYSSGPFRMFEPRGHQHPDEDVTEGYHYYAPGPEREDEQAKVELSQVTGLHSDFDFAYRCILRRVEVDMPGAPYQFWRSPSMLAVKFEYPTLVNSGSGTYTNLTDSAMVDSIGVNVPRELDGATADVYIHLDHTPFAGEYRWRYVEIELGYRYSDGSWALWDAFAGYIMTANVDERTGNRVGLSFDLIDASWAAKDAEVDESWGPLDGLGLNTALTYAGGKAGIPATRMSWHATDLALAQGPADDPIWWRSGELPVGMKIWDAMTRMANACGMALFVRPSGDWATLPRTYSSPVTHPYDNTGAGAGAADRTLLVVELDSAAEMLDVVTAIMAVGRDAYGRQVAAHKIDFDRERDPAHAPFAGRRVWRRMSGRRYNSAAAMHEVDAAWLEGQRAGYGVHVKTWLRPQTTRFDKGTVSSALKAGVNPAAVHLIYDVSHHMQAGSVKPEDTYTEVKMVRL